VALECLIEYLNHQPEVEKVYICTLDKKDYVNNNGPGLHNDINESFNCDVEVIDLPDLLKNFGDPQSENTLRKYNSALSSFSSNYLDNYSQSIKAITQSVRNASVHVPSINMPAISLSPDLLAAMRSISDLGKQLQQFYHKLGDTEEDDNTDEREDDNIE